MKPELKRIYLVVGSPISDIGKGWLTASVASLMPNSYVLKIDPMLNNGDMHKSGLLQDLNLVSTDFSTYQKVGVKVTSDQFIYSGNVLRSYLTKIDFTGWDIHSLNPWKRFTFSDVAEYFATHLKDLVRKSGKETLIIEIGGSVYDPELTYIPAALKKLSHATKAEIRILLLSYLDYSEDDFYSVKMQLVVQGIQQTRKIYGEPYLIFFRSRHIPNIAVAKVKKLKREMASRAAVPGNRLIYLPNFKTVIEERDFLKKQLLRQIS